MHNVMTRIIQTHSCQLSSYFGRLSYIQFDLFLNYVEYVELVRLCLLCRTYVYKWKIRCIYQFLVVRCHLGRAIQYRSAVFQHSVVRKALQQNFISYSVHISLRNAYTNVLFVFFSSCSERGSSCVV